MRQDICKTEITSISYLQYSQMDFKSIRIWIHKIFITSTSYHKHQKDWYNNLWASLKCSVRGCLSNNIFKSRMRWRHHLRLQHHFGPDQIAIYLPHQGSKSVEWRVTTDALKCPLGCWSKPFQGRHFVKTHLMSKQHGQTEAEAHEKMGWQLPASK